MWYFQVLATLIIVGVSALFPDFWQQRGELAFLISGFLTLGLFHGSADLLLLRKIISITPSRGPIRWFAVYVGLMGCIAGLWILIPQVVLLGFLLISIFHFGESQFWGACEQPSRLASWIRSCLQWVWGSWVIFTPIILHAEESMRILRSLGSFPYGIAWLEFFHASVESAKVTAVFLGLGAIVALLGYFGLQKRTFSRGFFRELSCLVLLQMVYLHCSLLTSFGLYFVIWHSMTSLRDQVRALKLLTAVGGARPFDGRSELQIYIRAAVPYWGGAVGVLALLMFTDLGALVQVSPVDLVFLGAIVLTPPHTGVLSLLNRRVSGQSG